MIGIAAVFGAVSIFAADFWLKSEASQQVETRTIEIPAPAQPKVAFKTIVVASEPLRFGMQLDRAQLSEIQWPQDALPHGAFPTIDALLAEGSRVVLSPMEPNEPVLLAKLSGTERSCLAVQPAVARHACRHRSRPTRSPALAASSRRATASTSC